jgi:hypothetical protein
VASTMTALDIVDPISMPAKYSLEASLSMRAYCLPQPSVSTNASILVLMGASDLSL